MSEIQGPGNISSNDMSIYRQQFKESVELFDKSLQGYSNSKGPQQAEFKKAMDESLQIMDQLGPLFNKEIQKQKAQLESDYQQYTADHSQDGLTKVQADLSHLKSDIR